MSIAELLALEPGSAEAFQGVRLGYTESPGSLSLRREIAGLYEGFSPEEVLVHSGAEEAIFTFAAAALRPGDRVIVQMPCYQSLEELARTRGCEVVPWRSSQATGWSPDLDELDRLARPKARALIINTPHNPTGFHWSRRNLEGLVNWTRTRGMLLFCDEVYRLLERTSADRLPGACTLGDHVVSLGVMSKSLGLAGLRIGWAATRDRALLEGMAEVKDYTTICSPGPSEFLAEVALRQRDSILERTRGITEANLKSFTEFMERRKSALSWIPPKAGPVCFPRVEHGMGSDRFCERVLKEAGVLLLPGSLFGEEWRDHFRVGLGRASFGESLSRLDRWMDAL
jgi:aspartate/methionine/tyrosine aminotransferase